MSKRFLFAALALFSHSVFGYVLEDSHWTLDRTVELQLSLGGPRTLMDGFSSFNESAQDALRSWNLYMAHMQFSWVLASPVVPSDTDEEMSAAFGSDDFGEGFGSDTLAITTISNRGGITDETDTIFNTAFTWNSYNGPLLPSIMDFHRVAVHEFGHVVGLDHPDTAGQHVVAIMNSIVSDIDTQQPDDIAGAKAIYGSGPAYQSAVAAPVLANISTRAFAGEDNDVLIGGFIVQGSQPATVVLRAIGFSLDAQGFADALPDPTITVYDSGHNQVGFDDDWITGGQGETLASYHLDPPNSIESAVLLTLPPGAYTAVVQSYSDASEPAQTGIALFELYDLHTTGGRAGNISTRGLVTGGDQLLIGGFIIGGTENKPLVIRALGPSLTNFGVTNPLADPFLELHNSDGAIIQSNDNWADGADAAQLQADGFAPTNAKEAALETTLVPGSYTAIVSGANGSTGTGLVEVYDMSPPPE